MSADAPQPDASVPPGPDPDPDLDAVAADLADAEQALDRLGDGSYWTDEVTGEAAQRRDARRAPDGAAGGVRAVRAPGHSTARRAAVGPGDDAPTTDPSTPAGADARPADAADG